MLKACSRCILDSSFPNIYFDTGGVCNYCLSYEKIDKKFSINKKNDEKLKRIIEKIKNEGKNKEYDCIQGVSGGRDSTYCLYLLKQWGLNPVAVHFDNNMDSKIAAENIKNACKKLDVDLHTFVIDWDEYKDLQRAFLKASVPSVDIPMDHAFVSVLYDFAFKNKIGYIINGYTFRGEGIIPPEWTCNDISFLNDIHKRFGTKKLEKYPLRKYSDLIKYRFSGMKIFNPLNYIRYVYAETMPILETELGWKYYGGHHFENIFTRWAFAFYLPYKFAIDKRITDYSTLIRSGQLSRDEAISKISESIYSSNQEKDDRRYIMNKLELSELEIESILNSPPNKNTDYKTNSVFKKIIFSRFGPKLL